MALGLKLILVVGFILNFVLGFALSGFIVDRLTSPRNRVRLSIKSNLARVLLFVTLGTIASVVSFALSIIIIWPPHIW